MAKNVGLAEKVGVVVLSGGMAFIQLVTTVLAVLLYAVAASEFSRQPQNRDIAAGLLVLLFLALIRGVMFFVASEEADWLFNGIFRLAVAGVLYMVEGAVLGHGFRGTLWVAIIAYQCVAAVFSFIILYGVIHGFHVFDPQHRKQARFEKALMADLQKSL